MNLYRVYHRKLHYVAVVAAETEERAKDQIMLETWYDPDNLTAEQIGIASSWVFPEATFIVGGPG